jgi:hypothetical protein
VNYLFRGARGLAGRTPALQRFGRRPTLPPAYVITEPEEAENVPEAQVAGHGVA